MCFNAQLSFLPAGFHGCLVNFTINNEVQSFQGGSRLLQNVSWAGEVLAQCPPSFLSSSNPVNVGVIIVLVFFVVLIIAILGSFFLFRLKKKKYEKTQNRSAHTDSSALGSSTPPAAPLSPPRSRT